MANEHFSRKPTSEGNRKVWTWSAWLKQSNSVGDGTDALFSARSGNQQSHIFIQHGTGNVQFYSEDSGGTTRANIKSIIDVNDVSGWYHILLSFNCVDTDGNSGVDFYVNGVLAPRDTSEGTALQDVVHNFNTSSLIK